MITLLLSFLSSFLLIQSARTPVFRENGVSYSNSIEGKQWVLQKIRFLQDNIAYYYDREDRPKSTIFLDNDYIVFGLDGTGIYHQTDNTVYKIAWNYADSKSNAIVYIISRFRNDADLVVYWENIDIRETQISYTEYYTHTDGTESLAYGIRNSKTPECKTDHQLVTYTAKPQR